MISEPLILLLSIATQNYKTAIFLFSSLAMLYVCMEIINEKITL